MKTTSAEMSVVANTYAQVKANIRVYVFYLIGYVKGIKSGQAAANCDREGKQASHHGRFGVMVCQQENTGSTSSSREESTVRFRRWPPNPIIASDSMDTMDAL